MIQKLENHSSSAGDPVTNGVLGQVGDVMQIEFVHDVAPVNFDSR